jgi:hypothetical protein
MYVGKMARYKSVAELKAISVDLLGAETCSHYTKVLTTLEVSVICLNLDSPTLHLVRLIPNSRAMSRALQKHDQYRNNI